MIDSLFISNRQSRQDLFKPAETLFSRRVTATTIT